MRARLEKSCARCKKTTIDTYMWNIKALAKVAGLKSVPNRMDWVTKSLLEKIKKLPISQYKRFAMAGVKVLSAFGKKNSSWEAAMRDSTDRYGAIRDKQKRTEREAKNWPEGGYAALKKLADKLYEGVSKLEGRKKLSPGELYRYQKYVIIRFYSEHALRGDLADLRIKRPFGKNYINKSKGSWVLYLGEHKTVKARGAIQLKVSQPVQDAFDHFVPMVKTNTSHGFLLTTLRTKSRLQRADMLKLIRGTTMAHLGKNIGVQIIRVLKTTAASSEIGKAEALRMEMGHSARMQHRYVSK